MSAPASLPKEIHLSAKRGELQKVVKWLRKGGLVDAFRSTTTTSGEPAAFGLLYSDNRREHLLNNVIFNIICWLIISGLQASRKQQHQYEYQGSQLAIHSAATYRAIINDTH